MQLSEWSGRRTLTGWYSRLCITPRCPPSTMTTINAAVNCRTSRVIYCTTCTKPRCRSQYCWKTVSEFRTRMYQHRVSVMGTDGKTGPNLEKAVGAHFNGPGHKVSDMSVTKTPCSLLWEKLFGSRRWILNSKECKWTETEVQLFHSSCNYLYFSILYVLSDHWQLSVLFHSLCSIWSLSIICTFPFFM